MCDLSAAKKVLVGLSKSQLCIQRGPFRGVAVPVGIRSLCSLSFLIHHQVFRAAGVELSEMEALVKAFELKKKSEHKKKDEQQRMLSLQ